MNDILVAKRYSQALMSGLNKNEIDSILMDIELMSRSLRKEPELADIINSYLFPLNKRMDIALGMTDKLVHTKIWENLFKILLIKHRFNIITVILKDLERKILKEKKQVKVNLIIAHKLQKSMLKVISEKLKDILHRDVILDVNIDPDILGGFIASTESLMIDGSIKNNLVKLLKIKSK